MALGLVIVRWSEVNPDQMDQVPSVLKENLMQLLVMEDHYEETGSVALESPMALFIIVIVLEIKVL